MWILHLMAFPLFGCSFLQLVFGSLSFCNREIAEGFWHEKKLLIVFPLFFLYEIVVFVGIHDSVNERVVVNATRAQMFDVFLNVLSGGAFFVQ